MGLHYVMTKMKLMRVRVMKMIAVVLGLGSGCPAPARDNNPQTTASDKTEIDGNLPSLVRSHCEVSQWRGFLEGVGG
jgi:hypothetical protein